MKLANKNIVKRFEQEMNFAFFKRELRYSELWVSAASQNRPVIWFVAKREGYNGMMQNNDISEDSTDVILKELLSNEQNSLSQKASVKIYPNPFGDYIIVESPDDDEILIQEPTGRIVMQQKILKGQNRIQSERLTGGIYFVRFVNQSQTVKLIKQ